ncbi:hypothetical protein MTR_2g090435 [Medicago truncatula]|uniref:Uncharacterized protein n=1 Tax=Medicago truncatula TaxID=3880 RepID=A0A072VCF6_MEDTR|nr:hypothetical protein MTR_2g090435 [Medicago truncatula]
MPTKIYDEIKVTGISIASGSATLTPKSLIEQSKTMIVNEDNVKILEWFHFNIVSIVSPVTPDCSISGIRALIWLDGEQE